MHRTGPAVEFLLVERRPAPARPVIGFTLCGGGHAVRKTETSHFWVGHFPDGRRAGKYFAETYGEDDDDAPVSPFARAQGVAWYDHDFLEYGFSKGAKSIEKLVKGYSYAEQWAGELARRVADARLTGVNMFAFINKDEIDKPRSVKGDGYWLHYLGTIRYRTDES